MRPRTPAGSATSRPPVPAVSHEEEEAIVQVVRGLHHAQSQVATMIAQLDRIAALLREVQAREAGRPPAAAPEARARPFRGGAKDARWDRGA